MNLQTTPVEGYGMGRNRNIEDTTRTSTKCASSRTSLEFLAPPRGSGPTQNVGQGGGLRANANF